MMKYVGQTGAHSDQDFLNIFKISSMLTTSHDSPSTFGEWAFHWTDRQHHGNPSPN